MKKLLASLMVVFCLGIGAVPAFADSSAQITINGELCDIPEGYGRVFVQNDRTYVPVRFVTEQLGCTVDWDETHQTIIIAKDMTDFYFLQSGNKNLLIQKSLLAPAQRIEMDVETYYDEAECRNYIPVRFLAEAMGYTVEWDQGTETVSLIKAE